LFPEQWEQLREAVPAALRDGDITDAYCRLLHDPDASIREQAALAWCTWESATPAWPPAPGLSPRFRDPSFRMAFARIVTHYVSHNAWLEDNCLIRDAAALADIPGIMVNGRFDLQAPIGWAYDLKRACPRAKLVIVNDAGHDASNASITQELVRATDQFASRAD
jgi:proline iminopeptidase